MTMSLRSDCPTHRGHTQSWTHTQPLRFGRGTFTRSDRSVCETLPTHTHRQRHMHVLTHIIHWPVRHCPHTLADAGWVTRKCRRVDSSSQGPVRLLSSCPAYTQTYISTCSQNHTWSWTKNCHQVQFYMRHFTWNLCPQNSIERFADFHKIGRTEVLHKLCTFCVY